MERPQKPSPVVTPWARPYWDAANEGRLTLQKCADCDQHVFIPRFVCPHCFSENLDWVDASGKGTIYSYSIVQNNAPSAFIDDMPYVVAIIRLEEGVQMLSNIVDCDFEKLECDMPVEVTFEKLNDEFTLPKFRPVKG
ncbi:Zn-ribbon domain-containing OB-fold protein [Thermodesulfobacteriota bacterium]